MNIKLKYKRLIKTIQIVIICFLFTLPFVNVVKADELQEQKQSVILSQLEVTLGEGETLRISTELDENKSYDFISYHSDNIAVATVDEKGMITANMKGITIISAFISDGNQVVCKVVVKDAPTGVLLPLDVITIEKNSSYTIVPELRSGYSNSNFIFDSNNQDVALVEANGVVKALNEGVAKITVSTYNNKKSVLTIKVVDKLASLTFLYLPSNRIDLAENQSRTLYYQVTPFRMLKAVKEEVKWISSNEKVAIVDQKGTVTAKKEGTAKITLTTNDGSAKKITIIVKVSTRKKQTTYKENDLSIVNSSKSKYTYVEMTSDLKELEQKYGDCISVEVLSDTYDGRKIYQVILGNKNAKNKIMVQSSIHAREYMTTLLTMKQIEFYCKNYYSGMYENQYFNEIFQDVAFYIVPMSNPDGVTISQFGALGIKNKNLQEKVISICKKNGHGKKSYYEKWKANARGVDLNLNFNQYWDILRINESQPSGYGYKGKKPVSEIETKTLVNMFYDVKPVATISYHATGSIIFWDYGQKGKLRKESFEFASRVKSLTSYNFVQGFSKYNANGFSDWVSISNKTPAITIEIGRKACPLDIKEFPSIWSKNKLMYVSSAKMFLK